MSPQKALKKLSNISKNIEVYGYIRPESAWIKASQAASNKASSKQSSASAMLSLSSWPCTSRGRFFLGSGHTGACGPKEKSAPYGSFLKWGNYPQIIHLNGFSIINKHFFWGYFHLWKHHRPRTPGAFSWCPTCSQSFKALPTITTPLAE